MGGFAEMAIERDWEYSYLSNEKDFEIVNSEEYSKIDKTRLQDILSGEDGFLIRKQNGSYNILCTCIWQNEKSILCKIEDFGERKDVGRKFFCPKSIIQYNKNEKSVLYVPNWAKLKYTN